MDFKGVCETVFDEMSKDWRTADEFERAKRLEKEKRAIMGFEEEILAFSNKIAEIINEKELSDSVYPPWYKSLTDAVFHELYGLSGLAPWVYDYTDEYRKSSSAKLIGDKLFCLINGVSVLQPQRIPKERREQLKRAFLLSSPRERLEYGFHEVYLNNGIRVTVYSGERTKTDQDIMVFRKYVVEDYTFESIAELGTIPYEAVPIFKAMVKAGFNVLIGGPVRSGKTTFLQIWQSYEDSRREGLAIATDPETDWTSILKEAPIMQLVADGIELEGMLKSLLRGDNDYVLLEEMRDAAAFKLCLDIIEIGSGRSKATVHARDPISLPYRMAESIRSKYGGEINSILIRIFSGFDFFFLFAQNEDCRSEKKLLGMFEYCYDSNRNIVEIRKIIEYNPLTDSWEWNTDLSEGTRKYLEKYPEEGKTIMSVLRKMESVSPIAENRVIVPGYFRKE